MSVYLKMPHHPRKKTVATELSKFGSTFKVLEKGDKEKYKKHKKKKRPRSGVSSKPRSSQIP